MADRYIVRISLYESMLWGSDSLTKTVPEAAQWLKDLERQVPAEFKDVSVFEIEHERDSYDGSSSVTVRAYYERPETDEEMAARIAENEANAAAARAQNEQRERQIYEQLRRKFG